MSNLQSEDQYEQGKPIPNNRVDVRGRTWTMRGGRQLDASTVTIAARGVYAEPVARAELVALIGARA